MQTHATPTQGQAQAQTQQAAAAKLLAGAATGDFLALLMQQDRPTPKLDRTTQSEYADEPTRDRPEPEAPDATAMPGQARIEGQIGAREAASTTGRTQADAAMPGPKPDEAKPQDAPKLKATVETVGLDSRPRAALSAGASAVALAEASQPAQNAKAEPASPGQATAEASDVSQRPDFAKLAKAAARGGDTAQAAQATSTTAASLDAQAEKTLATKTQTHQAVQPAQSAHANPSSNQANTPAAMAQQVTAQAAERTTSQALASAQAGGKAGGFVQALTQSAGGLDGPAGLPGSASAGKTDGLETPKPTQAPARSAPQPAVDQVAVQIRKAAATGKDSIQIKLNPAELGRVDVKLEFQADGGVRAVVAVERPETLDLLQRDARGLERALADAGFRGGQTSLSFEMQNQGGGQQFAGSSGDGQDGGSRTPAAVSGQASAAEAQSTPEPTPARTSAAGGIDIRI